MNRYEHGKIYRIVDVDYNKCYIGSTCEELSQRMARHRREYKRYTNNPTIMKTRSSFLFDEYGVENCKIELIEKYPTNSKEELLQREGFYIKSDKSAVNRCIAGRTKKEYYDETRENHLEHKRQHRLDNIEKYKEKDKTYYENNKEKRNEYSRNYYSDNRDTFYEKNLRYREEHRDQIRKQQNERYERDKDEINRRRRERCKQKKQEK